MNLATKTTLENLKKLQGESNISDFIIQSSSGREWKVHKAVLFLHSDVLYRMSVSPNFVESQSGRVVLEEFDDSVIDAMVEYFYQLKISHGSPDDVKYYTNLTKLWSGLWQIADMYNIQPLMKIAVREFCRFLRVSYTRQVESIDLILDAVAEIEHFPDDMWKSIVKFWVSKFSKPHGLEQNQVEALLKKHTKFANDVLPAMIRMNRWDDDNDYESSVDSEDEDD